MRRVEMMSILWVTLAIGAVLLVAGVIGVGAALHTDAFPPLDVHLTLDGRYALVLHYNLPCMPAQPPTDACGARQFQLIYSTPRDYWVLLSIPLPEH